MKNIPDHIVFDENNLEYDAFKKPYPTSLSSPNFKKLSVKKISHTAIEILKTKFNEISKDYKKLLDDVKDNEMIYNAKYNFKPLPGKNYYLYSKKEYNFLSIIKPKEWDQKYIGTFTLMSNELWKKQN